MTSTATTPDPTAWSAVPRVPSAAASPTGRCRGCGASVPLEPLS